MDASIFIVCQTALLYHTTNGRSKRLLLSDILPFIGRRLIVKNEKRFGREAAEPFYLKRVDEQLETDR